MSNSPLGNMPPTQDGANTTPGSPGPAGDSVKQYLQGTSPWSSEERQPNPKDAAKARALAALAQYDAAISKAAQK